MSVRMLGALGLTLAAMTGGAQASSIVFLGVSTSTPSVIKVGGAEPVKIASSPSIVALGDPQPDVTYEKVAAIPEKPRHGQAPMIIRGGIVGGAFAAPAPAKASAAAAPAANTTPGAETAPAGTATASKGKPGSQPAAPQPAATPQQPIQSVGKAE
ncbi:hypothetical protein FJV76_30630 [Mesorhizobium sp. WSM4303]|uniref:hypothetical protein n=1 Tax=unclassified Mesorhizobium TaxID=325217 RepID=UPI00115E1FA0|nr:MULTISPECIES: hypothetical protein [unclassified Mesorhizobium]TRC86989.1 hypothetical protein FJV77_30900 [Mesorhizobium sp. WSM4306]TRC94374.1 hypothetical protein FJV76_30630 [Mesorhizobium sp. WSM4303]